MGAGSRAVDGRVRVCDPDVTPMSAQEVDVTEQDVLIREVRGIEIPGLGGEGSDIIARIEDNGCWTWMRYIDPDGYGRSGRGQPAHREVRS
jgi:hypothetical protein